MRGAGDSEEVVTIGNRSEYVRLLCHHLLTYKIEAQTAAVMRGLLSIFPTPLHEVLVLQCPHSATTAQDVCLQTMRQCLTAHELDILIAGKLSIDIDDWQQFTKYDNYTNESPQVVWFWELLRSWDQDRLSKLLLFVTGGYCHTALPGSRGFSTKHPDGCRGCTFMPDVFARAHRPHRPDHTCIWGSASGLASGCGGGSCALDLWLLQNSGRAHVPVRATSVGM